MTIEAGPDELFTTLATPADVPAIVTLVNGAYRGTQSRRGWTSEEHLIAGSRVDAAGVAALLAAPGDALLVIRSQSALNGCVHLKPLGGGTSYLGLLSVRPAMQGSLLGRSLLAAAERYAREQQGATRLEMTVIEQREELIAWCERRGYRRTGELRPFPYDDASLGTPTRADLRFVVLEKALG